MQISHHLKDAPVKHGLVVVEALAGVHKENPNLEANMITFQM